MAKENISQFVILGVLSHEPQSGYDIKKRIEGGISFFWDVGYGQIYPSLKKLVDGGQVTVEHKTNEKNQNKKIYTITESGIDMLEEWLRGPVRKEQVRFEILLRTFFGKNTGKEKLREQIEEFRNRQYEVQKIFDKYEDNLRSVLNEGEDHFFYLMTLRFGQHMQKAYLNWSDEVLEEMESVEVKNGK